MIFKIFWIRFLPTFFGHSQIRIVFLPDFTELKRVPRMSHNDDAVNISLSHAKRSSLSPNLHGHQNHFSHETWNSSDDLELRSTTKNQKIRRMWSTMQRLVTEPIFQSVFSVTLKKPNLIWHFLRLAKKEFVWWASKMSKYWGKQM